MVSRVYQDEIVAGTFIAIPFLIILFMAFFNILASTILMIILLVITLIVANEKENEWIWKYSLVAFLVGFCADLFLNVSSRNGVFAGVRGKKLKYYFNQVGAPLAAVFGGMLAVWLVIPSAVIWDLTNKDNENSKYWMLPIGFAFGFIIGMFSQPTKALKPLLPFYKSTSGTIENRIWDGISVVLALLPAVVLFDKPDFKLRMEYETTPENQKGSLFNKNFMHYRIGDVFKYPAGSFHGGHKHPTKSGFLLDGKTKALELNEYHLTHFPNSLASQYLKKKTKDSKDYKALAAVLKKECPLILKNTKLEDNFPDKSFSFKVKQIDSEDTAVVHARLGDTSNEKNVKMILQKSKQVNLGPHINKLIIICGMHFGTKQQENKSKLVLEQMREIFNSKGIKSIVISNSPDEDACVLAKAHTVFIPKHSGFSDVLVDTKRQKVIRE